MKWLDVEDIAIALEETYPAVNILSLRFTALWEMITTLSAFDDDPQKSNEKILEAIQMAWLEERR
jgi:FeS assembly protein IscX